MQTNIHNISSIKIGEAKLLERSGTYIQEIKFRDHNGNVVYTVTTYSAKPTPPTVE